MNNQPHRRHHWFIALTVGCVASWLAGPAALSQDVTSPVFVASLAYSSVTPWEEFHGRSDRSMPTLHRKPQDADAWNRFDAEYRPPVKNPSAIKSRIETAKFGLDTTVFAVDRFARSIREHADFEYVQGNFHRTPAKVRDGLLNNPRVKLDLDLTHGKPYLGVRFVIPLGR